MMVLEKQGIFLNHRSVRALTLMLLAVASLTRVDAQSRAPTAQDSLCRVEAVDYQGWHAQQISNRWVQMMIVPQNGGRLMQVTFAGHPFLFVNPKYAGKYLPPDPSQWFNYGGDKIWLLPEGNDDEQHWPGGSDLLDDGPYSFHKVSEGQQCEIELTNPADPQSGIQFVRTIRLDADSPRIRFHVAMKNTTGHDLVWSMQSVSQYDTSDPANPSRLNRDFRAFTRVNPSSSYLNSYHVRYGPAENRSVSVRDDGLFVLKYSYVANELWVDSTAGWVAVVDGNSRFAMVERFRYEEGKLYPGKASVIFWTNGADLRVNEDGMPSLSSGEAGGAPFYMEAEINSPLCRLRPGESCNLDTEWFPTRAGEVQTVKDAGIVEQALRATVGKDGKLLLTGAFGVFFPGRLVAHIYNEHGRISQKIPLADVDPADPVKLDMTITPSGSPARVSLHLEDRSGLDRGSLQEVQVEQEGSASQ